jgi:hypothetical protein
MEVAAMSLQFPNQSRVLDPKGDRVRFWAHDAALEVPFTVDVEALAMLGRRTPADETECLAAFDSALPQIQQAARDVKTRGERESYHLTAENF